METETKNQAKNEFNLDVAEMARAGLCFGHRSSQVHPKMKPYLQGVKNTIHIIDLEKTIEKFTEALKFIPELISEGRIILLVGTKIQIKDLVENIAKLCGLPYVTQRWLGGTFTNFEIIKKRVQHLKELEEKKEKGELEKYTKKEKIKINHELQKLKIKFEGIKNLNCLPDAVFVCDMKKDYLAVKEARGRGIKVIGIADTNVNPNLADYPIPASDDAISSVKYILEKVKEVILKAKSESLKSTKSQAPNSK